MNRSSIRSLALLLVAPFLVPALRAEDAELARRLGDVLWVKFRVGSREVYGPRPVAERLPLLEDLVRRHPEAEEPVAELARARVAVGEEAAAWAAYQGWVRRHPRPEEGLARQAEFLVGRGAIPEALGILEKLAARRKGKERAEVYTRALQLVERYRPPGFRELDLHRSRVAADPEIVDHVLSLLDAVQKTEGAPKAIEELDRLVPDPGVDARWIKKRTDLLLAAERPGDARTFLEGLVASRGKHDDHIRLANLLRRLDLFDEAVAELVDEWSSRSLDVSRGELLVHWLAHAPSLRGTHDAPEASAVLEHLEALQSDRLDAARLGRLAELWGLHQVGTRAVRLRYRAFLAARAAGDAAVLAAARRELIGSLLELDDPGETLRRQGRVVRRSYTLDPHPGVIPGAASLLLGGEDAPRSMAALGRNLGADDAVARLDAWVAEGYRESPGAPEWESILRRLATRWERQEVPLRGADLLLRYAADVKAPEDAARLRLDALELVARLPAKKLAPHRPALERLARKVLDRATEKGWEKLRRRAFSALETSLRARQARQEVLALYRGEIQRGADARTFQSFLSLLSTYKLHQEAEGVYDEALSRFGGGDWFSRAARWYLRLKRTDALDRLSRRAVKALSSGELSGYLGRFTSYGGRGRARDNRLYLELHRAALDRWPHELGFVRSLVRYHAYFKEKGELEKLRMLYGVRIPEFWTREMQRRMGRGGLEGTIKALTSQPAGNTAARIYLARSHEWLSRFEQALPIWRGVVDLVPDQVPVVEATARALRSRGDPLDAEPYYLDLARLEPLSTRWPTLVGEVRIEGGDLEGARQAWRNLSSERPGDVSLYKEGATVLWDYYLFDDAVAELEECRRVLGLPHVHAKELSAVHESRRDFASALREAARHLVYQNAWDTTVRRRISFLADRGHAAAARQAFEVLLASDPGHLPGLEVYGRILSDLKASWTEERAVLEKALSRTGEAAVLAHVRDRARAKEDDGLERKALERKAQARGRATGALFELARFYARVEDRKASLRIEKELRERARAMPRTRRERARRIHRFLGDLLFERGDAAEAFGDYRSAVERAVGTRKESERLNLARRYLEGGKAAEARKLLETLVSENPRRREWVFELADLAVRGGDPAGLEALYKGTIAKVKAASGLSAESRSDELRVLRRRWIGDLRRLQATERLAPVLIELVRAEPANQGLADEATRVARTEGVLPAFEKFFVKWAKDSPKDHRAHRLLGWITRTAGRLEESGEHLARAIREEPQKVSLRLERAGVLTRLRRYDDALGEYAALRRGEKPDSILYLEDMARLERLAGRPARARQHVDGLRPPGLTSELEASQQERYANALWEIGARPEALRALEALLDTMEGTGPLIWSPTWAIPERLANWMHQVRGGPASFDALKTRAARLRAGQVRSRSVRARERLRTADWLDGRAREVLIRAVRERGPARERRELRPRVEAVDTSDRWNPERFWKDSGYEELYTRFLLRPMVRGREERDRYREQRWEHLERTGRHEALAEELSRAGGRGRTWERARAWRRLARLHRRNGDEAQELQALDRVPGEGDGWYLEESERRRFLDLVDGEHGDEGLLRELGERGLWGLNEALRREKAGLAMGLLDLHFGPQEMRGGTGAWTRVRPRWERDALTRIGERFQLPEKTLSEAYRGLLDLRTIRDQVEAAPDPEESYTSSAWFEAAHRYAGHLRRRGRDQEARRFATALLEGSPRSAGAALRVAELLYRLGDEEEALRRLEDALARSPGKVNLEERAAELLHEWGRTERARKIVRGWVKGEGPGSMLWDRFARVMVELGARDEVGVRLGDLLAGVGPDLPVHRLGALLELAETNLEDAARAGLHEKLLGAWKSKPARLEFLARRSGVAMDLRVRAFAAAVAGHRDAPRPVRLEYQRRLAELQAFRGDRAGALTALDSIRALENEVRASGKSPAPWTERRIRVLHALGKKEDVAGAIRQLHGMGGGAAPVRHRVVAAHALLMELGLRDQAAALRREYYRERYRLGGHTSRDVLAGLARETARAREEGPTRRWLEELLRLDPHDTAALGYAAATLESLGEHARAVEFRRRQVEAGDDGPGARLHLGLDLLEAPATREEALRVLAGVVRDRRSDEAHKDRVVAALYRTRPTRAELARAWTPSFPDAGAAEALEGLGMAALGRGDAGEARTRLAAASAAQVRRVGPGRELLELARAAGKSEAVESRLLELRRREALRSSGPSRWLKHRVFLHEAEAGRWHGALAWLDLSGHVERWLRGDRPPAEEEAALRRVLGEPIESGDEDGYQDVEPEVGPGSAYRGEGQLLDWGGDRGLTDDPFPLWEGPRSPRQQVETWSEGLGAGRLLELAARAREETGDLEGARKLHELMGWLGVGKDPPGAVRRLEDAIARETARRERRLVLANDDQ